MKVSSKEHNVANWIADHVARRFPELAADPIPGVWFTGSNVWSLLYGIPSPSAECADWDIFTIGEATAAQVALRLELGAMPACRTKDKRTANVERSVAKANVPHLVPGANGSPYGEGYSYLTPRGEVDLWISSPGDALAELRTYPTASHAHCRAAFSFTDGLVILPNECAAFGARTAQRPLDQPAPCDAEVALHTFHGLGGRGR